MLPNPNRIAFFLMLLVFGFANSQQLKFRTVSTDSLIAVNVKVVNLVTEKTAVSNGLGEFFMDVKPDHVLILPQENYEYKRYLVTDEDMKKKVVTIVLIPRPIELNEVTILKDMNPEDLGLVPKGQKQYTPAERKLYTATSGPVDIITGAISGRTKMLKKQAKIEKKEGLFEKLRFQFDDSLYTQKLKIPSDYIKGFQYYCIEDNEVIKALNVKNKAMLLQRISQMAPVYVEMIAKEESESEAKP